MQLFKTPHVVRDWLSLDKGPRLLQRSAQLRSDMLHPALLKTAVHPGDSLVCIGALQDGLLTVSSRFTLALHAFVQQPAGNLPFSYRETIKTVFNKSASTTKHSVVPASDGKTLFVGNNWDDSFRVYSCESVFPGERDRLPFLKLKIMQHLPDHKARITCVALAAGASCVATGSRDATVRLWDVLRPVSGLDCLSVQGAVIPGLLASGAVGAHGNPGGGLMLGQLFRGTQGQGVLSETPRFVLHGHESELVSLALDAGLGLCASVSASGLCLLHSMRTGLLVRRLELPLLSSNSLSAGNGKSLEKDKAGTPRSTRVGSAGRDLSAGSSWSLPLSSPVRPGQPAPKLVRFSSNGDLIFFASHQVTLENKTRVQGYIAACGVNGRHWRWQNAVGEVEVMETTKDGKFLAVGNSGGQLLLMSLDTLQIVQRFERSPGSSAISSVAFISGDKYLVAGTSTGALLVYGILAGGNG